MAGATKRSGTSRPLQGAIIIRDLVRRYLQIVTYCNLTDYYNEHTYETQEDVGQAGSSAQKDREWDYDRMLIALRTVYSVKRPIYEEGSGPHRRKADRRALVKGGRGVALTLETKRS